MKNKKNDNANIENKKGIFFLTGLILALGVVLAAFEWKSQPKPVIEFENTTFVDDDFVFIPQTEDKRNEILPPKVEVSFFELIDDNSQANENLDIFETEPGEEMIVDFKNLIFTPKENINDTEEEILLFVQDMPEFPGGEMALLKFLSNNIKYPAIAQENGIEGRVIVSFVVDRNGSIKDVNILRGVDVSLNEEALRVVQKMPKWKPGKQGGKAVNVRYNVPINFDLH